MALPMHVCMQALHAVRTAAASLGARELSMEERPAEAVPFNCIPFVPPEKPTKHAAAGLKLQKQQQVAFGALQALPQFTRTTPQVCVLWWEQPHKYAYYGKNFLQV